MATTRDNGMVVPTNDMTYNLTGDLAIMADSTNVVIRVPNQASRDALTKENGLVVIRQDLPGAPIERCDGTTWFNTQHMERTFSAGGIPPNTVWGIGTSTNDITKTTDATFVTAGIDTITLVQPGTYSISYDAKFGLAVTNRSFLQILDGGTLLARSSLAVNEDSGIVSLPNYRCTTAKTLTLSAFIAFASGVTTSVGRIRVTRIGY